MTKNKTKSGRKSAKASSSGVRAGSKPVDMDAVRRRINNLVGNRAVKLVETTITEAGKGHYGAMKYLFEMVGLYPATEQQESAGGEDSLARTLLRRIGVPEDSAMEPGITKDCRPVAAAAGDDAVE